MWAKARKNGFFTNPSFKAGVSKKTNASWTLVPIFKTYE
jgi:hypothetical protein